LEGGNILSFLTSNAIQQALDNKTKPHGALGVLENIAFQIASIQDTLTPQLLHPAIFVFAGDHGITKEGVSPYPQEVTLQMVHNFLNGGAAINVFCRQHNIDLKVVDAGINGKIETSHPSFINKKVNCGTENFLKKPAMTLEELLQAFLYGRDSIENALYPESNVVGFGEMGIGNTSSASMIAHFLCGLSLEESIGSGAGMYGEMLQKKKAILYRAAEQYPQYLQELGSKTFDQFKPMSDLIAEMNQKSINALQIAMFYGGFEIVMMCGAMLAAYKKNLLLLIDGFIATAAYLIAYTLNPRISRNAFFTHLSEENAHKKILESLGVTPLLSLNMRLGEGTGCAVAYPIICSAVLFLNEMAGFDDAHVSRSIV
jgi:nicotinate-nucleotide--dimethylbenzimidazole phosphoribosyltransferase